MNESERRQALADFLRKRRARLSPGEVGLPPGIRRRTPGLRREEVAQLANIGTSWYVWLEQGRDIHPSVSVLESLAQVLRLTPNERRHLFLLAGQSLPPHTLSTEEHLTPALQQVLADLNPTPAYVMGRRWDYLAWNNAAESVFAIAQPAPPHSSNLIWRLFTSPTSKACYPNWEQLARGVLAEFHTASARYTGDAWFEELVEDLKEASPEFGQWWSHQDAPGSIDGHKIIKHLTLGHLEFEHITLQMPSDPDVRIMIYTPNAATRAKLERFLELVTSR
ncbi:MAG: helix-turn-helix domain-containing protein [Ktedonobacteraceae bacterium]|nr:helix-turn-helix domain-containing protein [Ktedonobacteraceae bacterium]